MKSVLSDEWAREVHNGNKKTALTFCGALEKYFFDISFYWNASTKKKNISSFDNIILPAMENHNYKTIDDYTREDFEEVLRNIKNNGFCKNNIRQSYSDATINGFAGLIYDVVYYASQHNVANNVLWGTSFVKKVLDANDKIQEKIVLKKSLSVKQEKSLAAYLLYENITGEEFAVLLMFALGLRNAEACGLNYGDIKELNSYKDVWVAMIYKTTIPHSNILQSSGKTWNSGRIIPVPTKVVEILKRRRDKVEKHLKDKGLLETISVDILPIACTGEMEEYDNYLERATAENVNGAAKRIFSEIGITSEQLAYLENELSEDGFGELINEKEPTAYLLRRNYATHLDILGLDLPEIQYLMGHDIEEIYESRNDYIDDDRIYELSKKLSNRPLVNDITNQANIINIEIDADSEYAIYIKSKEPMDPLNMKIKKSAVVEGFLYENDSEGEYSRSIDVISKYKSLY